MSLFRRHKLPELPDVMRGEEPLSRIRVGVGYKDYLLDNVNDPSEVGTFLTQCAERYAANKPVGHEFKVNVAVTQTPKRQFDRLTVSTWAYSTETIRFERFSEFSDHGHVFFVTYHYRKVVPPAPRHRRVFKKSSAH